MQEFFHEKKNMYIVKNFKFDHMGTSSSNDEYKFQIGINRNWHFSWSKFYFYKKNYNYFYALKRFTKYISKHNRYDIMYIDIRFKRYKITFF